MPFQVENHMFPRLSCNMSMTVFSDKPSSDE